MGLTSNVASGAPVTSAWGNEIRDRSVQVFDSAAQRTAQWTAPPEGAVSYLKDVDRLDFYTGTAWRPFGHLVQSGTTIVTTNASGDAVINYPTTFRAGTFPAVSVHTGDETQAHITLALSNSTPPNNVGFWLRAWDTTAHAVVVGAVRVVWGAVGEWA
jgi:hypothetical protein